MSDHPAHVAGQRSRDAVAARDKETWLSVFADDAIVEEVRLVLDADPERPVLVATSDRELRSRVERLGAVAVGAGEFRRVLDGAG